MIRDTPATAIRKITLSLLAAIALTAHGSGQAPPTIRLYALDGGTLESDPARYQLKKEEVAATPLVGDGVSRRALADRIGPVA